MDEYVVRPIGRVESPLVDRSAAPRQGDEAAPDAWLVLRPAPVLQHLKPGLARQPRRSDPCRLGGLEHLLPAHRVTNTLAGLLRRRTGGVAKLTARGREAVLRQTAKADGRHIESQPARTSDATDHRRVALATQSGTYVPVVLDTQIADYEAA
jgi:hypothetical protein